MRKNKLLAKIIFSKPRKGEVSITDNELIISGVSFFTEHKQDCCEEVYADFSQIEDYRNQILDLKEILKMEVKNVEDTGFIIFLYYKTNMEKNEYQYCRHPERLGILVNCYNEQNGYYSDELILTITDQGKVLGKFEIDKKNKI